MLIPSTSRQLPNPGSVKRGALQPSLRARDHGKAYRHNGLPLRQDCDAKLACSCLSAAALGTRSVVGIGGRRGEAELGGGGLA